MIQRGPSPVSMEVPVLEKTRLLKLSLALVVLTCIAGHAAFSQELKEISASPSAATSNSIITFSVTWDPGSSGNYTLTSLTLSVGGTNFPVTSLPSGGGTVKVKLTGGLGLMDPGATIPDTDVLYCPALRARGDGSPQGIDFTWTATYLDSSTTPPTEKTKAATSTVTIHDSFVYKNALAVPPIDIHKYGGVKGDRDYLLAHPYQWPNLGGFVYPLTVTPTDTVYPDDGSSSSSYHFRIHYVNSDGLPPKAWLDASADSWQANNPSPRADGVVLYLGRTDVAEPGFEPHFMFKENPSDSSYSDLYGVTYIVRVDPVGSGVLRKSGSSNHWVSTRPWFREFQLVNGYYRFPYYVSLEPGTYQYFFACSDDDLSAAADKGLYDDQTLPYTPATGVFWMPDAFYGHWVGIDDSLLIDKVTYFPGPYFYNYPFPSWAAGDPSVRTHPVVNPGLEACYENSMVNTVTSFEDPLGGQRFLGTLYPYREFVNPLMPNQESSGEWRLWSETAGATTSTNLEFRIVYKHSEGKPPLRVELCIKNGNYPGAELPADAKRYQMKSVYGDAVPPADAIKQGVVYKITLNAGQELGTGPHYYWFEANDGTRTCHYPRRPDEITYNGATFNDSSLPTVSAGGVVINNDIINGPYVNNKPVLSEWSLTPPSGVSGTDFRFSVKYSDADGQRPQNAFLVIKEAGADDSTAQYFSMAQGAGTDYRTGYEYYLNSGSIAGFALKPGVAYVHRYEFTDNWGRQTDPKDMNKPGETVVTDWLPGPFISENTPPVLYDGGVESSDASSNEATQWTYRVTYKDEDNQSPAYVKVFIGTVDGKGTADTSDDTITWDAGHKMDESATGDTVYSDGKEYVYRTRLGRSSLPYYYCFVAADRAGAVAQFDEDASPSAHTIFEPKEILDPVGSTGTVFAFERKPIVGGALASDVAPKIYLDGTLLVADPLPYTLDLMNGTVTFQFVTNKEVSASYNFGVPGPTKVDANTPPVLSAGKVLPATGTSNTTFTFSVVYRDTDGPSGQAPVYINVVVDGTPYQLTASGVNYSAGVTYTAQMRLSNGRHSYYFEASDGLGYAVFDRNGAVSYPSRPAFQAVPIIGPYVNDRPSLTRGAITPNDANGHSTAQSFMYTVDYVDNSGDAPDTGYPVVYIDNPNETAYDGTVTAVSATTLTDHAQNWTIDQFKGMPVQITSGDVKYRVYTVASNTANTLTLIADDLVRDSIKVGDTFSIGKLIMTKQNDSDNDYTGQGVTYFAVVPGLGMSVGVLPNDTHTAHFKAVATERNVGPTDADTRVSTVTYPASGELQGPKVVIQAPTNNKPPVLSNGGHTPASGTSATTFTFLVTYSDADGDSPTVRLSDKVEGYMRLVIDGNRYNMVGPAVPDYVAGAQFTYSMLLTPGTHTYYFEASDGWASVRLPSSGNLQLTVNRPPVLSEAKVTPDRGNKGMSYTYSVRYSDADNNPPASVKVVIDGTEREIKDLTPTPPGTNFISGVVYTYTLPPDSLTPGDHRFYFVASDGIDAAVQTVEQVGPQIHTNTAPVLSGASVDPQTGGFTDSTFTYSVVYRDPNGDQPEYVKVYIDGSDEAHAHEMTKNPGDTDYLNGVTYTYVQNGLSAGTHTFFCKASDYEDTDTTSTSNYPIVQARPTANLTVRVSQTPRLGQVATISGEITPAMIANLKIKITSPGNEVTQYSVTTQSNGSYSYSWTPRMTGTWKIQTTWAGAGDYLATSSPEISVTVSEPYTVSGLDMISIPLSLLPSNTYPDACFGVNPPFALAKYSPRNRQYLIYSLLPQYQSDYNFPLIATGEGYWIKTMGVPKTISPSGSMVSTSSSFNVSLKAGWNQIGCPFLSEVEWSRLRIVYNGQNVSLATAHANGWAREYGWTYDPGAGNYKLVDATRSGADRTIRPWRGYWIRVMVDCTLVIPPPITTTGTLAISTNAETMAAGDGEATDPNAKWQVRLIAKKGDLKDEYNYFGLAKSKAERIESPACLENYVDLYFTGDGNGMYATDLKSSVQSGDEWRFAVATDAPGEVTLTWEGLENVPAGTKLILVDEVANKSVQITTGGTYSFLADQVGVKSFRIRVEK